MQWLVRDARPNDSLFFHCKRYAVSPQTCSYLSVLCLEDSGHGGQTKDTDGDEADGFDEVIYPVDFKVVGHIVDDVSKCLSTWTPVINPFVDDARYHGQAFACWMPFDCYLRRTLVACLLRRGCTNSLLSPAIQVLLLVSSFPLPSSLVVQYLP